jgi:hypothetical protein
MKVCWFFKMEYEGHTTQDSGLTAQDSRLNDPCVLRRESCAVSLYC